MKYHILDLISLKMLVKNAHIIYLKTWNCAFKYRNFFRYPVSTYCQHILKIQKNQHKYFHSVSWSYEPRMFTNKLLFLLINSFSIFGLWNFQWDQFLYENFVLKRILFPLSVIYLSTLNFLIENWRNFSGFGTRTMKRNIELIDNKILEDFFNLLKQMNHSCMFFDPR